MQHDLPHYCVHILKFSYLNEKTSDHYHLITYLPTFFCKCHVRKKYNILYKILTEKQFNNIISWRDDVFHAYMKINIIFGHHILQNNWRPKMNELGFYKFLFKTYSNYWWKGIYDKSIIYVKIYVIILGINFLAYNIGK